MLTPVAREATASKAAPEVRAADLRAPGQQHVLAAFLQPFVDHADEARGAGFTDTLLAEVGLARGIVGQRDAWVGLRVAEAFCARFGAAFDDPAVFHRCGRLAFAGGPMAVLRPLLRTLGSPGFAYERMAASLDRFNKVGSIELVWSGPRALTLTYRCRPDAPAEREPLICLARVGQVAAIPTLFDLPPAHVDHPVCLHRGGDACVYHVEWRPVARRLVTPAGLLLGGAIGWLAGGPFGGAAGALVGGLVARGSRQRAVLDARLADIIDHDDALLRSAEANERRFAELIEAKRGVEAEVSRRTAELSEARDALGVTLAELRAANDGLRAFFAAVSHDLRTPLQLVLGTIETLGERLDLPAAAQETVDAMRRNARRLDHLIAELLLVARGEAGTSEVRLESIDLAAMARGVAGGFAGAAQARGLELRVTTPPPPLPVRVAPHWIESALYNLLANALRHAPEGSVVALELEADDEALTFHVEDAGPGVPEALRERIFQRFFQAAAHDARVGAMGLGLAIVREAAQVHGGTATVDAGPLGGARFSLTLPRRDARADAVIPAPLRADPASAPAGDFTLPGPTEGAPRALVVEVEPDIARFVGALVAEACAVTVVGTAEEGLLRAREDAPAVVLTDLGLPGRMDGVALVRALRAEPALADTGILVLTARHQPDDLVQALAAGADDYLTKPFLPQVLRARLQARLRQRALLHRVGHRERLASIGQLAAEVAHQVRNPLNVAMNALPLALEGGHHAGTMKGLIDDALGRINELSGDLLRLAGVDQGEPGPVDPAEGLDSTLRLYRSTAPPAMQIDARVEQGAAVIARPGDLANVWTSLVDNARRAAAPDGTVQVTGRVEDDVYRVDVEDDGPGLPPDVGDRVFEPFYTTRPAGQDTGLGLAVARRVVLGMEGTLEVDRSPALGGAVHRQAAAAGFRPHA